MEENKKQVFFLKKKNKIDKPHKIFQTKKFWVWIIFAALCLSRFLGKKNQQKKWGMRENERW